MGEACEFFQNFGKTDTFLNISVFHLEFDPWRVVPLFFFFNKKNG